MVPSSVRVRARAVVRAVKRAAVIVFLLTAVALPLPLVPFVAFLVQPRRRRNDPAEIERVRPQRPPWES